MIKLNELESFTYLGLKEAKALVEKTPAILKARLCKKKAREVDEAGTPEDQEAFIKDVKAFQKENFLEFKAPKFYGQPLNCFRDDLTKTPVLWWRFDATGTNEKATDL